MNTMDLMRESRGRITEELPRVLEGLDAVQLAWQPQPAANSIGWLAWHMARVEDDHLAGVAAALGLDESEQLIGQGWSERLGLPYPDEAIGYGMSSEDVTKFRVQDPSVLLDYSTAVRERTLRVFDQIEAAGADAMLDRIVDERWTPHVTAGVRLASVINDLTQHLGQAAYVRGLLGA